MRNPTCDCIQLESNGKELVSLWNSANVAEVKVTYGTRMVWLPINYCPQCGKPYGQTIKTIVECKLIQKMLVEGVGSPIVHNDGSCDGYSESHSDEPCVTCQNCNIRNGREDDDRL